MAKAGMKRVFVYLCSLYLWIISISFPLIVLTLMLTDMDLNVKNYCVARKEGGSYTITLSGISCDMDWLYFGNMIMVFLVVSAVIWLFMAVPVYFIRKRLRKILAENAATFT